MRNITITFALAILTILTSAQNHFNQAYNDSTHASETSTNILQLDDATFLVPGVYMPSGEQFEIGFNARRLDEFGNEVDQTFFTELTNQLIYPNLAEAFIQTSDDGYLQATSKGGHGWVIKLNQDLLVEWEFEVDSIFGFYRGIELSNGNFLVCGYTYTTQKIEMLWVSPEGEVLQARQANPYSDWAEFYNITSVSEMPNGNLLWSGVVVVNWNGSQLIFMTNSEGSLIWERSWNFDDIDWACWPIVDNDSSATVAFGHIDYVDHPWIDGDDSYHGRIGSLKLDLQTGDTSEVKLYLPELYYYWLHDFVATPDGGYAALCWYSDTTYGSFRTRIYKLDDERNLEWTKEYTHLPIEEDTLQYCQGYDLDVTSDSGFIVAGTWNDLILLGKQMPWVFKTDACGDLVWSNCGGVTVYENEMSKDEIVLYPNPTNDILNVALTSNTFGGAFHVYDAQGRMVASGLIRPFQHDLRVNVASFPKGIYIFQFSHEDGESMSERFIVND